MKKALMVLGVVIGVGAGLYGADWAEEKAEWRQHLPITEITVNSVERQYHLFVPTSPREGSMSLVVMLMGGDAGSWKFPQQDKWEELAELEGIIIAFPVGKVMPPNESAWQLNTDAQSRHDIDFMGAMIDDISSSHAADAARVFAVGYSLNDDATSPCSIRIFLRDGRPDGIRSAEKTMSTTQAIAFRRSQLARAEAVFREDLRRPGVYILLGADDAATDGRVAYIGESEGIGRRLAYHASPQGKKEFWEDTIILVSKDANLTKSHARYVESRLIAEAQLNPHWSLPNRQEPSKDAGRLPVADQYDMRKFVEEAKMLAGVLGCDLFRSVRATRATEEETGRSPADSVTGSGETFSLSGKGFEASMRLNASGDFVVQAGSRARLNEAPSIPDGVKRLREAMLEAKDLRRDGEFLEFSGDYSFRSVSSAAGVVHGASVNGRNVWKHRDGRTYGEWEAGEGPAPS
ncbi:MAG: DUF4357 domain-containing protein [Bryobacterales bacterium]|nr:DUF4357 domain-containing protein [Bryobacterales bacterium]